MLLNHCYGNLNGEQGYLREREVRGTILKESGHPETEVEGEQPQGALRVVTALASMYFFSILGLQGDTNIIVPLIGGVNVTTITVVGLSEYFDLAFRELGRRGAADRDS